VHQNAIKGRTWNWDVTVEGRASELGAREQKKEAPRIVNPQIDIGGETTLEETQNKDATPSIGDKRRNRNAVVGGLAAGRKRENGRIQRKTPALAISRVQLQGKIEQWRRTTVKKDP